MLCVFHLWLLFSSSLASFEVRSSPLNSKHSHSYHGQKMVALVQGELMDWRPDWGVVTIAGQLSGH